MLTCHGPMAGSPGTGVSTIFGIRHLQSPWAFPTGAKSAKRTGRFTTSPGMRSTRHSPGPGTCPQEGPQGLLMTTAPSPQHLLRPPGGP